MPPIPAIGHGLLRRLAAAVCAFALVSAAAAQTAEEVEARLQRLRDRIAEITGQLEQRREQRQSEWQALERLDKALAALALERRETATAIDRARLRIEALATEIEARQRDIETRREALAAQLRIAYRVGRQSRLKALLNQQDPAAISRQLALHGYLGRARLTAIAELEDSLAEQRRLQAEQQQTLTTLAALDRRQADQLEQQKATRAERQAAIEALDARIRDQAGQLAEMRATEQELDALLGRLADALADIPPDIEIRPFETLRGALAPPLNGPVSARFGQQRQAGMRWEGWLFEVPSGTEVSAVAYGRVAYADWLRGYGMLVILDHGDGYMSLYGQNQSVLVEVGDWVRPGQPVALAGDSGGRETAGLYFQIRQDGEPVDPARWIQR